MYIYAPLTLILLHLAIVLYSASVILRSRADPLVMLGWLLFVIAVPFIGAFYYHFSGENRIRITQSKALSRRNAQKVEKLPGVELTEEQQPLAALAEQITGVPPVHGNDVTFYTDTDDSYDAIEDAIRSAKHHVHMEYYIWYADHYGDRFRDAVIAKAKEGVEVRILLDWVGCFSTSREYVQQMEDAGVDFEWYLPVSRWNRKWSWHLRTHRKIVVVDGRLAFIGSQNIGDETHKQKDVRKWYDFHSRIEGPAVLFVQQTFTSDWAFAKKEELKGEKYFPAVEPKGDHALQILPTGPDQPMRLLEGMLFSAITAADERVQIVTPYFVPSDLLVMALTHAAHRKVKVQIIIPRENDVATAYWAGRSFYDELVECGVEVYEFTDGMLHSKIIVIDEKWGMYGSINMDHRSFRHNFEISAIAYTDDTARELSKAFELYQGKSELLSQEVVDGHSAWEEMKEGAARLLANLL